MTTTSIKIRVEKCIDSDEWVWSLLDEYNGVRRDGYSATEAQAYRDAKQARQEEMEWLNSDN